MLPKAFSSRVEMLLKKAHKVKCVVFEKTGTLTVEKPLVVSMMLFLDMTIQEFCDMAAIAEANSEFEELTRDHMNEYADAGLRTMVLAYRELIEEEYTEFKVEFTVSKNSVSADRETMIDEVAEKIENDLILLGSTAVEDKLQPGVAIQLEMFGRSVYTSNANNTFCIFFWFSVKGKNGFTLSIFSGESSAYVDKMESKVCLLNLADLGFVAN